MMLGRRCSKLLYTMSSGIAMGEGHPTNRRVRGMKVRHMRTQVCGDTHFDNSTSRRSLGDVKLSTVTCDPGTARAWQEQSCPTPPLFSIF